MPQSTTMAPNYHRPPTKKAPTSECQTRNVATLVHTSVSGIAGLSSTAPQETIIRSPEDMALNSRLEQTVLEMHKEISTTTCTSIYDAIEQEWNDYTSCIYACDPFSVILDSEKIYRFMFYQTFRPARKRGGKRGGQV